VLSEKAKVKKTDAIFVRVWLIGTLGALTLLIASVCFFHTDSFSLNKIKPPGDFSFQATLPNSQKDLQNVRAIISQPYTYLTEGGESYVFVSQDQQYVLKFFKMKRLTPKYWLNYIPLPWLDKKRLDKIDERERVRQQFFGGLKIAFEQFRYQTGLTFLHLFRTQYLKMKVRITDKEGKSFEVPIDQVPFLLQRKAVILPDYIDSLVSRGKKEEAVRALCQVLELVKSTSQKGFIHTTENVQSDYGFIDDRPIYVRSVYAKEESYPSAPGSALKEVFSLSHSIRSWLERNHPELVPDYLEEVQDLLSYLED